MAHDRILKHIHSKKHKRLRDACPRCSSLRMHRIPDECWDRDGIREARKCGRCLTEYKSYAHGIVEKCSGEYTGEKPAHIKAADDAAFHAAATARGYVLRRKR